MTIFQNKYTPHAFDDLVFTNSNTRKRLLEYANNQRHQSLIFHGPYGTAKTTTANLIAKERMKGLQALDVDFLRAFSMTTVEGCSLGMQAQPMSNQEGTFRGHRLSSASIILAAYNDAVMRKTENRNFYLLPSKFRALRFF